jgi:hypothetical protein
MIRTLLGATFLSMAASAAMAGTYTVTVTNNLEMELLAPILITDTKNDGQIFTKAYVTAEAEEQILTGDPSKLVARIGADAMVGKGTDGPPGVLLAPGKSVTFEITTEASSVRVLSMVAPTIVPDNYVTNVVDLQGSKKVTALLHRFDIGNDEKTMMNTMVSGHNTMKDGKSDDMAMATDGDTMASDTMATDGETMASDTMASDTMAEDSGSMMMTANLATITFVKIK